MRSFSHILNYPFQIKRKIMILGEGKTECAHTRKERERERKREEKKQDLDNISP